jgi:hypothetical protein
MKYDPKLDAVIEAKYVYVQNACWAWGRGKCISQDCKFLVDMDSHGE